MVSMPMRLMCCKLSVEVSERLGGRFCVDPGTLSTEVRDGKNRDLSPQKPGFIPPFPNEQIFVTIMPIFDNIP